MNTAEQLRFKANVEDLKKDKQKKELLDQIEEKANRKINELDIER